MRIANLSGRLVLLTDDGSVDVEEASHGQFGPDPTAIYSTWEEFTSWAHSTTLPAGRRYTETDLRAAVPAPGQIFAIGLNYRDHATESGFDFPVEPPVFTKFGPRSPVRTATSSSPATPSTGRPSWSW